MIDILDKIRKPSLFILLLILNSWLFFSFVFNDRQEVLYMLMVLFFFLSFDYKAIRPEYLYWLLIFIAVSVLDFSSHKMNVLAPIVLMQCASRVNIRTYLLYNIIILGTTAIVLFMFVGTGDIMKFTAIDFIRIRYDFGFGHPNAAAMYYWGLFISVILYCYLSKYRRLLSILLLLVFLASLFLYSETLSRSFIIALATFFLVLGYYSIRSRFRKDYVIGYSRYVLYVLPIILTALTLYFAVNVKDHPILDLLFSMRLTFFKQLLDSLTPLQYLLGSDAFDSIIVDSSYLHLLFEAGVFVFIYFIWLYYFAIKNIVRQQNYLIIAVFVSFLVYGLSECLLLLPMIIGNNLFWVLLYKYRQEEILEFSPNGEEDNSKE